MNLTAVGLTDVGKRRTNNEDAYLIIDSDKPKTYIYAVADGMGGHAAGEVASSMSLDILKISYETIKADYLSEDALKNIICKINERVFKAANEDINLYGMGNTLSIFLLQNNKFLIGHVGDSRIYRLRSNKLEKLTYDHTEIQILIDAGHITKEMSHTHPMRNMLRQAIGIDKNLQEIFTLDGDIFSNDRYLLCSDGLTDMLDDDKIRDILKNANSAGQATNNLVNSALLAGGYDNVTVIVCFNE